MLLQLFSFSNLISNTLRDRSFASLSTQSIFFYHSTSNFFKVLYKETTQLYSFIIVKTKVTAQRVAEVLSSPSGVHVSALDLMSQASRGLSLSLSCLSPTPSLSPSLSHFVSLSLSLQALTVELP